MGSNEVTAAIASICDGLRVTVNGVTLTVKGIDPPPAQLSTAKLPCVYALTGEATYDLNGFGPENIFETRQYRLQCVIEAVEQMTRETKETQTRAMIGAIRDRLAQYPRLGTDGIYMAALQGDTGPVVIQDSPNSEYVGFEMTLQVSELIARTYAARE